MALQIDNTAYQSDVRRALLSSTSASGDAKANFSDGNFLATAFAVMMGFMGAVTDRGNMLFDDMREKTKLSRDAQDMSNLADKLLAGLAGQVPEYMQSVPEELRSFMEKNNITIDGMGAGTWFAAKGFGPSGGGLLNAADLKQVKSALDNFGARSTDIAQQGNLEIQKITTTYNFLVTGCNSLTTLTGDLNKAIYSKL